jgi:hypothetical protein
MTRILRTRMMRRRRVKVTRVMRAMMETINVKN